MYNILDVISPGYTGWQAGTTALCRSQLCPPVRDYEFCYSSSNFQTAQEDTIEQRRYKVPVFFTSSAVSILSFLVLCIIRFLIEDFY